jgi:lipopolysaccharide biosynthesis glycosyltransferase
MNWKGRAIYLDSDMQVFDDLKEIWTMPFNGAEVLAVSEPNKTGRKPQFSVMLLDCNKLDWRINEIVQQLDQDKLDYKELMVDMKMAKTVRADISSRWNSLERYEPQVTGLIHYTDMDTQPWVSTKNPLGAMWVEELFRAIDDNFISIEYIETHIKNSWIRPSLLWQITNRIAKTSNLPDHVLKLDSHFVAPYQGMPKHGVSQWRKDIKKSAKKQGILFNFFERFQSLLKK